MTRAAVIVASAVGLAMASGGQNYRYEIDRDDALRAIAATRDRDVVAIDAIDLDRSRRVRLALHRTDEVRVFVNAEEGEEPSWGAPLGGIVDLERNPLIGLRFNEERWGGWLLWPGLAIFAGSMAWAVSAAIYERDPLLAVPVVGPILWARRDNPCLNARKCLFDGRSYLASICTAWEGIGLVATIVGYAYYRPTHEIGIIDDAPLTSWRWPSFVATPLPGGGLAFSAAGTF
jgi:hypothetical protein